MKHPLHIFIFSILLSAGMPLIAQIQQTANDYVKPYNGDFGYGTNVGYYPRHWGGSNWSVEQLGDLAMGNSSTGVFGAGVTTMRPSLPQWFQEQWGYDLRVSTFQHYANLGARDNVVFLSDPSREDRDQTQYCPGEASALFANMYEPIWDNGENGTPINDNNTYAVYVYKTVMLYKDYVKFWEVWNEPDFTRHGNYFDLPGNEGNWWDNNPEPCSYKLRAPIFHYIRLLRISYEVIKHVDEDAYVAVGGLGYPSFLDAILRNTDNPQNGGVTSTFPLKGGAYFDVMSYHTYPHIDGSLRIWNEDRTASTWKRNTDMAVDGIFSLYDEFDDVLDKHGYDGNQYPEKEWIITESQAPRKPIRHQWGSDAVQVNFILKALVESQRYNIRQFHVYTIGDKRDYNQANNLGEEYELMGFYKNLKTAKPSQEKTNDIALAYKTASDLLYGKSFDQETYTRLNLPSNIRGGVFKDSEGKRTYVLWAKTTGDKTEYAAATINMKELLGAEVVELRQWDFCETKDLGMSSSANIALTGTPIFITPVTDCADDSSLSMELKNPYAADCDASGRFDIVLSNGTPNYIINWSGPVSGRETINGNWYTLRNLPAGNYDVVAMDLNGCAANANITVPDVNSNCFTCDGFAVQLKNPTSNCSANEGSFDVAVTAGSGNILVEWSGAASGSKTISGRWFRTTNLPDGDYTVKVTDENGCTAYALVSLGCSCADVSFDLKNQVAANCGASNGTFDVVITGNHPNFKIAWSGPVSGSKTINGRWFTVRGLSKGNYSVTMTNARACYKVKNLFISEVGCGANMTDSNTLEDRGESLISTSNKVDLEIYPNPTTGIFTSLINTSETTSAKLELLDAVGRVLSIYKATDIQALQHQFDLSNYENGIYFVRLTTDLSVQTKPIALIR